MTNLAPHRSWSRKTRVVVATGALALLVVLGRVLVITPSAEAHADVTFTLIYSFKGSPDDGSGPTRLIRDGAGNFYGTTSGGGPIGVGTVFKLDATGTETVLFNFTAGADGSKPFGTLVRDAAGNLYGTTYEGGGTGCASFGCGTVFKLDPSGHETLLYRFTGGADGRNPYAGLVRDPAGNLYGTTYYGGSSNNCSQGCGTVFKLDTTGAETVLHSFTGAPDGNWPLARLIRDAAGNLYGTTHQGGASEWGTVFKLDATGAETVLYSFTGGADGGEPDAELILDAAGNLYGTTRYGGGGGCPAGCGTVFKLDTTGTETVLHSFQGNPEGGSPVAGLIRDAAGNLYGTTLYGGAVGKGTVFKLDPTGKETVLHTFTGAAGEWPTAGLIRDTAGNIYGTTPYGGRGFAGEVFKLSR
jgi:uncharacterized repeat protein (TIGR03803 family)